MSTLLDRYFPQTQSIRDTLSFIEQCLDKPTYNHVRRSALFSALIVTKLKTATTDNPLANVDLELVVVSNLLHDLAWNPDLDSTKQFVSQDKRFEVDGADAARKFLQGLDWDERRIQLVWDTIALHSTQSIAWYKEPEVAVAQYGIATDVYGQPGIPFPGVVEGSGVSAEDLQEAYKAYPSLKLAQYVKKAMCALCVQKPDATLDGFVSQYGEEYVEGYTLKGKRVVDVMKMREANEDGKEV